MIVYVLGIYLDKFEKKGIKLMVSGMFMTRSVGESGKCMTSHLNSHDYWVLVSGWGGSGCGQGYQIW